VTATRTGFFINHSPFYKSKSKIRKTNQSTRDSATPSTANPPVA